MTYAGEQLAADAGSSLLADVAPALHRFLFERYLPPPVFPASAVACETVYVPMRDGIRLATDIYRPPLESAPVVVWRTPVGRDTEAWGFAGAFMALARRGYVAVSQDCRGTGDSEPDEWDYYVYELDDGVDLAEWITKQEWYAGFIGSFGGSYTGQTQWCMATHPAMSAISPGVSGLGIAVNTAHIYMFLNSYAHVVGRGEGKVDVSIFEMERVFEEETMAGGYFNEPLNLPLPRELSTLYPKPEGLDPVEAKAWLWERYSRMSGVERAEFIKRARGVKHVTITDMESMTAIFGHQISHDRQTIPHASPPEMCRLITAPPLLTTGWYDWGLNDALATFQMMRSEARPDIAARTRIIVTPRAHNAPGYRVGLDEHPELVRASNSVEQVGLLDHWYTTIRQDAADAWPAVVYYLMGANEWRASSDWPLPDGTQLEMYLGPEGMLSTIPPDDPAGADTYVYDPADPTPTIGGSIVSYLYTPGSADVSAAQQRDDVTVYTSEPLDDDLDVVGPLTMILYASSTAVDTDFVARLSDVWPDGRSIQIQNGILRTRYRNPNGPPELLVPGDVYRLEIDMWATAMRFRAGHRLRVDISSADFPRWDRNANRGGEPGEPLRATQTIRRDRDHPSHLRNFVVPPTD